MAFIVPWVRIMPVGVVGFVIAKTAGQEVWKPAPYQLSEHPPVGQSQGLDRTGVSLSLQRSKLRLKLALLRGGSCVACTECVTLGCVMSWSVLSLPISEDR